MRRWPVRIEYQRMPIAILTPRGTVRTRKRPGKWSGRYPPGSPALWLAEGHVTCSVHCLNGGCKHRVDVRLEALPQERPWSRVGPHLLCTNCGAIGAVNIVPNWHDRIGHRTPFSAGWRG
jgi:hypothetical protein